VVLAASSTSEAVRMVAEDGEPGRAAIGNRLAAQLYGCRVLQEGIEDMAGNVTRFVWLARRDDDDAAAVVVPAAAARGSRSGRFKTSVVFWGGGDATPGWLVRCLSEFASRSVNLTRIESRPRRMGLGHYMFFVDLEGHADDAPVAAALAGLATHCEGLRTLGTYPMAS
jgi:prephenate dehydratase